MDVAPARLVEVVAARAGDVGYRRGHRGVDAENPARRRGCAPAEADEHARGARAHEVQGCRVGRSTADDDRHVEVVDELLEVEGLVDARDVLGRNRRATDDEQVHTRGDHGFVQLLGALRSQSTGHRDSGVTDLLQSLTDELGLDRLGVELLHPAGCRRLVERRDLSQQRLGVVVPGPEPLEIEDTESAELTEHDRRLRAHNRIHRGAEHRDVELERVDRPGSRDILGIAGAARGNDGDVVERVRAASPLGAADLDLHGHAPQPTGGVWRYRA